MHLPSPQDHEDPSDLVCLRGSNVRYSMGFSFSKALRTEKRPSREVTRCECVDIVWIGCGVAGVTESLISSCMAPILLGLCTSLHN